jgi:hypothetical protein
VAWLVARQKDGRWASDTYTVLGSGQALTPFVLYALSHAPAAERAPHRAAVERALDRLPLSGDEYPTYALALSILALERLRPGRDLEGLRRDLRGRQLAEGLGWSEEDPEYGGWDSGPGVPRKPACRRPDLSVTAFACEALGGDPKARRFAERCRAADGGFFFTPHAPQAHQNKAGPGRSYASATCDALRVLGRDPRGLQWLRDRGPEASGLDGDWGEALFYYESFARAKVLPSKDLAVRLVARQRADGSWQNPRGLMKEDDPLVATGLALIALGLCEGL